MSDLPPVQQLRLGVLGGGQLAAMLGEAAWKNRITLASLSNNTQDPITKVEGTKHVLGATDSLADLKKFFGLVDVVMFENEFVDCDLLEEAAQTTPDLEFFPRLDVIRTLQDKLRQKKLLTRLGVRTPPFLPYDFEDLAEWIASAQKEFGDDIVFKWSRLGYDGKGVLISPRSPGEIMSFAESALSSGGSIYAEKKIDFRNELAIVAVRDRLGRMEFYPLTLTSQIKGSCFLAWGPATAFGNTTTQEIEAQGAARAIAETLDLHGAFAVEFFEEKSGSLVVNEIAPRVHNTGHFSQDACRVSQFENHVRTALAHPVQPATAAAGYAMINLLGPTNVSVLKGKRVLFPDLDPDLHLHWYGKDEIRPGRKVGHVNGRVDSSSKVSDLIIRLKAYEKSWADEIGATQ